MLNSNKNSCRGICTPTNYNKVSNEAYIMVSGKPKYLGFSFDEISRDKATYRKFIYLNETYARKGADLTPRTMEELYGDMYKQYRYMIHEPSIPNEYQKIQLDRDPNYEVLCRSPYYVHIRVTGRLAQDQSEKRSFTLDDLFNLYRYNIMTSNHNILSDVRIDHNPNAHLWVFYVCPRCEQDGSHFVWIQAPGMITSSRFIIKNLDPKKGLDLESYKDTKSNIKYIKQNEDELQEFILNNYEVFDKALNSRWLEYFEGQPYKPVRSKQEWPEALIYKR